MAVFGPPAVGAQSEWFPDGEVSGDVGMDDAVMFKSSLSVNRKHCIICVVDCVKIEGITL
jgi:hypothetical protein